MTMLAADLEDKVAIVTGAAMGIGRACAGAMAARGARVFIADIDADAGELARREIEASGRIAHFVRTDVTCLADFEGLAWRARVRGSLGVPLAAGGMPRAVVASVALPSKEELSELLGCRDTFSLACV